jgi:hypothetical protein
MKIRMHPLFIIIPLVYLLLGTFFLYQHLSHTESFSTVISGISMTGKRALPSQLGGSAIRNIKLSYNGMIVPLGSRSVIIVTADGIRHRLPIQSYVIDGQEIRIIFKYNVVIRFLTDPHSQKVTMIPEIPALIPSVKSIIIPVSLARKTILETTDAGETLLRTPDEKTYYLKHPADTDVDFRHKRIEIHVQETIEKEIVLSPEAGKGRTALMWYEQEGRSLSPAVYGDSVKLFTDIAFAGWQRRFNPKNGQWSLPGGKSVFSEKGVNAFLSESLLRGVYGKNWVTLTSAFESGGSNLTLESATFMDDIVNKTDNFWGPVSQKSRQLRTKIEEGNIEVLLESDVAGYLQDFGLYDLNADFQTILMKTTPDMDLLLVVHTLKHLADLQDQGIRVEDKAEKITQLVDKGILPRIFWLGDGLYIFTAGGKADIRSTLFTGYILTRTAKTSSDDRYMAIGRKMILSSLRLNDESGILPEEVTFNGNEITEKSGIITPEEIYTWIRENPYYPRRVSLSREIDRNSWVWTSTPKMKVQHSPSETFMTFDFPRGDVHHFVLKGIRPFQEIHMHGIRWSTDRRFQYYSDGWAYDENTRTLYFKVTHRNETETIRIIY